MKKTALLLVTITQVFTTFPAENVFFNDGTGLEAAIFQGKGFEPDKNGVILTVNRKIYFHHYPLTKRSLGVPFLYYDGPNPYGMPSCTPSRISFFHFQSFSLLDMKRDIIRMNIPHKKKVEAVRAINIAMMGNPPNRMRYSDAKTVNRWQRWVETFQANSFRRGVAIWGKDLESLKKYNLVNEGGTLTKK
jgi:hypothetical protein